MKQITVTPARSGKDFSEEAHKHISKDGAVVLVADGAAAHRHVRKIYKEMRFPRPDLVNPRIFIHQSTGAWHLLLAPAEWFVELDEHGVPKAAS